MKKFGTNEYRPKFGLKIKTSFENSGKQINKQQNPFVVEEGMLSFFKSLISIFS